MHKVTLTYVGGYAGLPEAFHLDPEEGQKEEGIRLGRTLTTSPVLFDSVGNELSLDAKLSTGTPYKDLAQSKAQISVTHCWFKHNPEKGWSVTDQSSNGIAFSPPTDSATPAFARLPKGKSWPLRPGDILVFGGCGKDAVGDSILRYQVTSEEPPEPKQVTSEEPPEPKQVTSEEPPEPSLMQKMVDSLVEIEKLQAELKQKKDTIRLLESTIEHYERSKKDQQQRSRDLQIELNKTQDMLKGARAVKKGHEQSLEHAKKQLATESLTSKALVEALTACKEDLENANQELLSVRAIRDELQRFKNMQDPEVQEVWGRHDGEQDLNDEDFMSMLKTQARAGASSGASQTLAVEGASSGATETQAVSPSPSAGPSSTAGSSSKKSVTWDSSKSDDPSTNWVPDPVRNPTGSLMGIWVPGDKRKNESEKQESQEPTASLPASSANDAPRLGKRELPSWVQKTKNESEEGSEQQESKGGSRRRSQRRT